MLQYYILTFGLLLLTTTCQSHQNCSSWVTVKDGTLCWRVAKDNGITVESLYSMNPQLNCEKLSPGNKICIAVSAGKNQCTKTHKFKEGELCYRIWEKYDLQENEFMEVNRGLDCVKLKIGQKVCVDRVISGSSSGNSGSSDVSHSSSHTSGDNCNSTSSIFFSAQAKAAICGKRIVGYYSSWGIRKVTEAQLKKLTHVIFAFVPMLSDGKVDFESGDGDGVKVEKRFLDLKEKAKNSNSGVRVLFAVGGWENSQYFAATAADSKKRMKFIDSVADFISNHGIDGVNIDWEYPTDNGADKTNYVTLVRELREKLTSLADSKGRGLPYLITIASAAGKWNLVGFDLKELLKYVDFMNVMTYDYYGSWSSFTGPPAPLYNGNLQNHSQLLNADFSMKYHTCKTRKPSKLNMGLPFYGAYWDNVDQPITKTDDMWRNARLVRGRVEGGHVPWRDLDSHCWNRGLARWHEKSKSSYIVKPETRQFLGFENERSLKEKIKYADEKNLGGLMIWAIDMDDDEDTLLKLVSSASICGSRGDSVKYTCTDE